MHQAFSICSPKSVAFLQGHMWSMLQKPQRQAIALRHNFDYSGLESVIGCTWRYHWMECECDCSECNMEDIFGVEFAVGETAILQALEVCGNESSSFEFSFVEEIVVDLKSMIRMVSNGARVCKAFRWGRWCWSAWSTRHCVLIGGRNSNVGYE